MYKYVHTKCTYMSMICIFQGNLLCLHSYFAHLSGYILSIHICWYVRTKYTCICVWYAYFRATSCVCILIFRTHLFCVLLSCPQEISNRACMTNKVCILAILTKETHIHRKRDAYSSEKRPVFVGKETHIHRKRDPYSSEKRPIFIGKECRLPPNTSDTHDKAALIRRLCSVCCLKRDPYSSEKDARLSKLDAH